MVRRYPDMVETRGSIPFGPIGFSRCNNHSLSIRILQKFISFEKAFSSPSVRRMSEKKRIKSWFAKNIILPNNEIIDKPGYVVYRLGSRRRNCYLREVFMPEAVLAGIEQSFARRHGRKGRLAVYTAGKMWGRRFAASSGLPQRGQVPDKDLLGIIEVIMRMLESEYSSKVDYSVDLGEGTLDFRAKGLMVCRLSGLGDFLTGTLNGTWEHMMGLRTTGVHSPCEGKGGRECRIVCAPPESLGRKPHAAKMPDGLGLEPDYFQMNQPRPARYAKNSFKDLLEARLVEYEGGFFRYGKSRLILNEASSVYFLETVLGKMPGGEKMLFDAAFGSCAACVPRGSDPRVFLTGILPALGWGDMRSDGRTVACFGYPWTAYYKETSFPILRGMASGILSHAGGGVALKSAEPAVNRGSLDMILRG